MGHTDSLGGREEEGSNSQNPCRCVFFILNVHASVLNECVACCVLFRFRLRVCLCVVCVPLFSSLKQCKASQQITNFESFSKEKRPQRERLVFFAIGEVKKSKNKTKTSGICQRLLDNFTNYFSRSVKNVPKME